MQEEGLTCSQAAALAHCRASAERGRSEARRRLGAVLERNASTEVPIEAVLAAVEARGRVCIHFHPDRLAAGGVSVAQALLIDARYRSQFETRISNGGLTAFAGGERDLWEKRLFAGAYQREGATAADRPKYGALDLLRHGDGPAPRFGSCFLRLRSHVLARCSFSMGDSVTDPADNGVQSAMEAVVAGLLEAVESRGCALGAQGIDVASLVRLLLSPPPEPFLGNGPGRALDDVIEVQVHGPVSLADDVDLLVADPSFRGAATGADLESIAARFNIELAWHSGFEMAFADVPADFRGPAIPLLAARLQRQFASTRSTFDVMLVGQAAVSVCRTPAIWSDWGTPAESLQHLKQLWHVLVRYGHPLRRVEASCPLSPGST